MSFQKKTVRLANGLTIPYFEQGDRDGIPVVMVHGYSDSSVSFEPVLRFLPPSVRALAVTVRGHGDAILRPSRSKDEAYRPRRPPTTRTLAA